MSGSRRPSAATWLRKEIQAGRRNFAGLDFSDSNLNGLDLRGLNFRGAIFAHATLVGAKLSRSDLSHANLNRADLTGSSLAKTDLHRAECNGANFSRSDMFRLLGYRGQFRGAKFRGTYLRAADLSGAHLEEADFRRGITRAGVPHARSTSAWTDLGWVDLSQSALDEANLGDARLWRTNFAHASLREADMRGGVFSNTVLAGTDLTKVKNLEKARHLRPSHVDFDTLLLSGGLPASFLRGVGWPNELIRRAPELLLKRPTLCFISYARRDFKFTTRLHRDLEDEGIRTWRDHEHVLPGVRFGDAIDEAITSHPWQIVVLSSASLSSEWVQREVAKALALEAKEGVQRLLPIRIDDAVSSTERDWARQLRKERHIIDFAPDRPEREYRAAFAKLMEAILGGALSIKSDGGPTGVA